MFLRNIKYLAPLWHALSPRRRVQLLGLQVLSLLAAIAEVANLGALLPLLRLLSDPQTGLSGFGPLAAPLRSLPAHILLLSLGIFFMIVVIMSTLLRAIAIWSQQRLSALMAADLGEQVFAAVLSKSFGWHLKHNSSSVLSNLTKDVDQVYGGIQALTTLIVNIVIVLLLGGFLVALSPSKMIVVGSLLAGFYIIVFLLTKKSVHAHGEHLISGYHQGLQISQEALGGIRDVLLDRSQPFFIDNYRQSVRLWRWANSQININAQVPRFLVEGFAVLIIIGLSLSLSLSGQGMADQLPMLGTLVLGAYRLLQPMQQCFSAVSTLQANQASFYRIEPFLTGISSPLKPKTLPVLQPCLAEPTPLVELDHVHFQYSSSGAKVLTDLNLRVCLGERIGFVGTTGSGKSTTSDVILGLLPPTSGKVIVHGIDLHGSPGLVEAWQQKVAHVPQQIYLSDASFAANIAFGIPSELVDSTRVRLAAEQAHISSLIEQSPLGYDTVVGERGVRLSGGQRQRIGIARALYRQAELLVLDEATSALDNRTEAEVMSAVDALSRQITVILIAHRLSTLRRCDRIVLLDHGRIIGQGSYDELEKSSPAFQELARQGAHLPS